MDMDVSPFDNSKTSKEDWLSMANDNSLDITHPMDGKDVYMGSGRQ
nr:hypothetical protein [uncultured Acetatifactor sp.]